MGVLQCWQYLPGERARFLQDCPAPLQMPVQIAGRRLGPWPREDRLEFPVIPSLGSTHLPELLRNSEKHAALVAQDTTCGTVWQHQGWRGWWLVGSGRPPWSLVSVVGGLQRLQGMRGPSAAPPAAAVRDQGEQQQRLWPAVWTSPLWRPVSQPRLNAQGVVRVRGQRWAR